ncbi:transmembrane protein, putative [Medicago truncatula]|uniref:Transmembrane protein, putative n=1 Tax=Medicago truncatula TaxID=3880 RepID=G7LJM8_MEDTR|nr:transmembrane protein, putative [Medicago truncatula]
MMMWCRRKLTKEVNDSSSLHRYSLRIEPTNPYFLPIESGTFFSSIVLIFVILDSLD